MRFLSFWKVTLGKTLMALLTHEAERALSLATLCLVLWAVKHLGGTNKWRQYHASHCIGSTSNN